MSSNINDHELIIVHPQVHQKNDTQDYKDDVDSSSSSSSIHNHPNLQVILHIPNVSYHPVEEQEQVKSAFGSIGRKFLQRSFMSDDKREEEHHHDYDPQVVSVVTLDQDGRDEVKTLSYKFNKVFDKTSSPNDIYEYACSTLIRNFVKEDETFRNGILILSREDGDDPFHDFVFDSDKVSVFSNLVNDLFHLLENIDVDVHLSISIVEIKQNDYKDMLLEMKGFMSNGLRWIPLENEKELLSLLKKYYLDHSASDKGLVGERVFSFKVEYDDCILDETLTNYGMIQIVDFTNPTSDVSNRDVLIHDTDQAIVSSTQRIQVLKSVIKESLFGDTFTSLLLSTSTQDLYDKKLYQVLEFCQSFKTLVHDMVKESKNSSDDDSLMVENEDHTQRVDNDLSSLSSIHSLMIDSDSFSNHNKEVVPDCDGIKTVISTNLPRAEKKQDALLDVEVDPQNLDNVETPLHFDNTFFESIGRQMFEQQQNIDKNVQRSNNENGLSNVDPPSLKTIISGIVWSIIKSCLGVVAILLVVSYKGKHSHPTMPVADTWEESTNETEIKYQSTSPEQGILFVQDELEDDLQEFVETVQVCTQYVSRFLVSKALEVFWNHHHLVLLGTTLSVVILYKKVVAYISNKRGVKKNNSLTPIRKMSPSPYKELSKLDVSNIFISTYYGQVMSKDGDLINVRRSTRIGSPLLSPPSTSKNNKEKKKMELVHSASSTKPHYCMNHKKVLFKEDISIVEYE